MVAHGREGTEEKFEDNVNVEEESKMPEKSKKINQSRQSIVVLDAKVGKFQDYSLAKLNVKAIDL